MKLRFARYSSVLERNILKGPSEKEQGLQEKIKLKVEGFQYSP